MKLIPIMTEKSMKLSKNNIYTFWMPVALTKTEIKNLIAKNFKVEVVDIKTVNYKARKHRNMRGQEQKVKAAKKAIVVLKEGQKLDFFEEEKKVTKKAKTKTKKEGTK